MWCNSVPLRLDLMNVLSCRMESMHLLVFVAALAVAFGSPSSLEIQQRSDLHMLAKGKVHLLSSAKRQKQDENSLTAGEFLCDAWEKIGMPCEEENPFGSEILRGHPDYVVKLNEYLAPVASGKWKLCFRASEHEYSASAFHAACDDKGPTVTVVRVGNYVFGGYADKSWNADDGGFIYSTAAFLFSLKNHKNQQYKMLTYTFRKNAIFNADSFGPTFGGGKDLYITDKCNVNTHSYTYLGATYRPPSGYVFGSSQTRNLLAGSFKFKCDEYEVFYQV